MRTGEEESDTIWVQGGLVCDDAKHYVAEAKCDRWRVKGNDFIARRGRRRASEGETTSKLNKKAKRRHNRKGEIPKFECVKSCWLEGTHPEEEEEEWNVEGNAVETESGGGRDGSRCTSSRHGSPDAGARTSPSGRGGTAGGPSSKQVVHQVIRCAAIRLQHEVSWMQISDDE